MQPVQKTWLYLIPLLLIAFWLGARAIDLRAIWGDEAASLIDSGEALIANNAIHPGKVVKVNDDPPLSSPIDIWNEVAARNPWHPPGFFILLNAWGRLVSRIPAALRVLSMLCGMLTIAWTYRLGRDTVSARVGLYGAAILSTGVMFSFYQDQIRVYMLLTLLVTFTFWLYLRLIRAKSPQPLHWICLFLAVTVLLYSHYFGVVALGAIGFYHLLFVAQNRRWWALSGLMVLAGALFIPWTSVLLKAMQLMTQPQGYAERALSNVEILQVLAGLFSNGLVLLLVAALIPAFLSRLRGSRPLWFFAAVTLILLLVVNAVAHVIPLSRLRYLMMLWPLFALCVAMGLVWLQRHGKAGRWVSLIVLVVWAGAGVANNWNDELIGGLGGANTFPFQRIVRALKPDAYNTDLIVLFWPADTAINYNIIKYYSAQFPTFPYLIEKTHGQERVSDNTLNTHDRVWVADLPNVPASEELSLDDFKDKMNAYVQCPKGVDAPDLSVALYAREPVCCGPGEQPVARFGNGLIDLTGVNVTMLDGGKVNVSVGWMQADDFPAKTYAATLQVFNSDERKVAQKDAGLEARAFSCPQFQINIDGLKLGHYDIRAGVYERSTLIRLPGMDTDGAENDLITVSSFEIS